MYERQTCAHSEARIRGQRSALRPLTPWVCDARARRGCQVGESNEELLLWHWPHDEARPPLPLQRVPSPTVVAALDNWPGNIVIARLRCNGGVVLGCLSMCGTEC